MLTNYALVFPGQGSQTVGMLQALADIYPQIAETFAEASAVLGYDLAALIREGPAEQLNQTEFAQPGLLASEVAVWRVWQSIHADPPAVLAGHSLGEYSALVCAGVLDFTAALQLVRLRGQLMQKAFTGAGAMVALVGLSDEQVAQICHDAAKHGVLEIANFNSIGQTVLSGELAAAQEALQLAQAAKAKVAKILSVSVPSHCSLMKPAAQQLAVALQQVEFKKPNIPVINNVNVAIEDDPAQIRQALVAQLYSPVRWVEIIQKMSCMGVTSILECGPGKVLTGLNKRIERSLHLAILSDPVQLQEFAAK